MVKTKVFNGKKYTMFGNPWSNKPKAINKAKFLRSKGYPARVIPIGKKWAVYYYARFK